MLLKPPFKNACDQKLLLLTSYLKPYLINSSGSGGSPLGDKRGGGELLNNFLNSGLSSKEVVVPFFLLAFSCVNDLDSVTEVNNLKLDFA